MGDDIILVAKVKLRIALSNSCYPQAAAPCHSRHQNLCHIAIPFLQKFRPVCPSPLLALFPFPSHYHQWFSCLGGGSKQSNTGFHALTKQIIHQQNVSAEHRQCDAMSHFAYGNLGPFSCKRTFFLPAYFCKDVSACIAPCCLLQQVRR